MRPAEGARRRLLVVLAVGVGLALAPAVFQMFSRAPAGGTMIDDFRPYMDEATIGELVGHLDAIDAAAAEEHPPSPAIERWNAQWPAIDADMREMLTTMEENLGEYRGVAALPPFALFPWFFVIPGVLTAVLAAVALRAAGAGRRWPRLRTALVVVGVGLIAAPAVFQMFTRAPGGARMIDDFRPMMTTERVTAVQGYFLVLGAAEGELRQVALPAAEPGELPATRRFVDDWPQISNQMAPMIGTMSDNVGAFAGIDALPPFWLFPWFFVAPGALVVVLAATAPSSGRPRDPQPGQLDRESPVERTSA